MILLAGGQGTRLGSSAPKGCYDIGLPSKKSLFQLQAERIHRLQQMSGSASIVIPWYIMTSGPTRADTEAFFQKQNYFGLNKQNIIFFEQGEFVVHGGGMCVSWIAQVSCRLSLWMVKLSWKIWTKSVLPLMGMEESMLHCAPVVFWMTCPNVAFSTCTHTVSTTASVSILFTSLDTKNSRLIFYGLVRVADPIFLGFCISKGAKCGAKVVRKVEPAEPVGVVCKVNGKYGVVEYSEISKEDSEKKRQDGTLSYDAANIANHYYSLDFLKQVCTREFEQKLDYHVAHKKIKHIDPATNQMVAPSKPNGVKMELFIFDIFPFLDAKSFFVLSVPRSAEFSPLKNAPGAGAGCPETSRRDIFAQSVRFLKALGCEVKASGAGVEKIVDKEYPIFEISPLVSYDGESLEFTKGKSISISKPTYVNSVDELKSLLV